MNPREPVNLARSQIERGVRAYEARNPIKKWLCSCRVDMCFWGWVETSMRTYIKSTNGSLKAVESVYAWIWCVWQILWSILWHRPSSINAWWSGIAYNDAAARRGSVKFGNTLRILRAARGGRRKYFYLFLLFPTWFLVLCLVLCRLYL